MRRYPGRLVPVRYTYTVDRTRKQFAPIPTVRPPMPLAMLSPEHPSFPIPKPHPVPRPKPEPRPPSKYRSIEGKGDFLIADMVRDKHGILHPPSDPMPLGTSLLASGLILSLTVVAVLTICAHP